jgi:hypothetical protein
MFNIKKIYFIYFYFQDPALKPREVHRGLDGLPDIPDGNVQLFWPSKQLSKVETSLKMI